MTTHEDTQIQAQNGLAENEDEDVVTPWVVTSTNDTGIDYDKLISESLSSQPRIFAYLKD